MFLDFLGSALDRLAESLQRMLQLSDKMRAKATHMQTRQVELSQVQRDTEPKVTTAIAHAKNLQREVRCVCVCACVRVTSVVHRSERQNVAMHGCLSGNFIQLCNTVQQFYGRLMISVNSWGGEGEGEQR